MNAGALDHEVVCQQKAACDMQITGYFLLSNSVLHSNEYIVRTLIIS